MDAEAAFALRVADTGAVVGGLFGGGTGATGVGAAGAGGGGAAGGGGGAAAGGAAGAPAAGVGAAVGAPVGGVAAGAGGGAAGGGAGGITGGSGGATTGAAAFSGGFLVSMELGPECAGAQHSIIENHECPDDLRHCCWVNPLLIMPCTAVVWPAKLSLGIQIIPGLNIWPISGFQLNLAAMSTKKDNDIGFSLGVDYTNMLGGFGAFGFSGQFVGISFLNLIENLPPFCWIDTADLFAVGKAALLEAMTFSVDFRGRPYIAGAKVGGSDMPAGFELDLYDFSFLPWLTLKRGRVSVGIADSLLVMHAEAEPINIPGVVQIGSAELPPLFKLEFGLLTQELVCTGYLDIFGGVLQLEINLHFSPSRVFAESAISLFNKEARIAFESQGAITDPAFAVKASIDVDGDFVNQLVEPMLVVLDGFINVAIAGRDLVSAAVEIAEREAARWQGEFLSMKQDVDDDRARNKAEYLEATHALSKMEQHLAEIGDDCAHQEIFKCLEYPIFAAKIGLKYAYVNAKYAIIEGVEGAASAALEAAAELAGAASAALEAAQSATEAVSDILSHFPGIDAALANEVFVLNTFRISGSLNEGDPSVDFEIEFVLFGKVFRSKYSGLLTWSAMFHGAMSLLTKALDVGGLATAMTPALPPCGEPTVVVSGAGALFGSWGAAATCPTYFAGFRTRSADQVGITVLELQCGGGQSARTPPAGFQVASPGSWSTVAVCPDDSAVIGFQLRSAWFGKTGSDVRTGVTGLRLVCSDTARTVLSTSEGGDTNGTWLPPRLCPGHMTATGIAVRTQAAAGQGGVAVNDVRLECNDDEAILCGNLAGPREQCGVPRTSRHNHAVDVPFLEIAAHLVCSA